MSSALDRCRAAWIIMALSAAFLAALLPSSGPVGSALAPASAGAAVADTPPTVSLTSPTAGSNVSHVVPLAATASDDVAVVAVDFFVDGTNLGQDTTAPYTFEWNSTVASNGTHTLTARARDTAGNQTTSTGVSATSTNPVFVNEVVVPDIAAATTIAFLPDGRMLVGELTEKIWVVQPGANQPDPTPVLQLPNTSQLTGEQGLMDILLDPNFSQNGWFYVFYTRGASGSQNHNGVSRFTASGNTTVPGSEVRIWEEPEVAGPEHHGGSLAWGADGKLYISYGDQFNGFAQNLDWSRGKLLRINKDGSVPTDNPFHDGAGPHRDEIWAYGLRNPFRMSIDPVTDRMYIADVGGNTHSTSVEEVNLGLRGANYGWGNCEGPCSLPGTTDPLYFYPHLGRDASITGGVVYRGTQFPPEYRGSYFFGDYVQNTIRRLTFDASGNVTRDISFWPADGAKDTPAVGDPVKFLVGPDGALYYVDIGFNDNHEPNPAAIRRIRYIAGNQPPTVVANGNPTAGLAPLPVTFSSAGSTDPEGQPLTYSWTFGDGGTSTQANPTHTYQTEGQFTARLTVSDGENSTISSDVAIRVGNPPTATILTPTDGRLFQAGEAINYSGSATDPDDGPLPASAFSWTILFRHDSHLHPAGGPFTNTTTGTLQIPLSGHDFQGSTRYEIVLTVTDSSGLSDSASVTVVPDKVNLSFDTVPSGLTVEVDGIGRQAPFVLDDVKGFQHTINAPAQSSGGVSYTFNSWSDGGSQSHGIVVPTANQSYGATFNAVSGGGGLAAAYSFNEGVGSSVGDASGNGNVGSVGSASWITTGRFGNALSFNGAGARVTVPDSPSLDLTSAMTLEAWVFPTAGGGWRDVIYKGPDDVYYLMGSSDGGLPATGGTFSPGPIVGTAALPLNVWSHLAATYDGATLRLFVGGVQVASRAVLAPIATSTGALTIGGDALYGQHFAGRIDEVRIYGRALSAGEIQADMATPVGGAAPPDTQAPTTPTGLSATPVSATQINLAWSASTDNVGVTGYRVERCLGAACSNFVEVGTPTGASFSDTGLAAATTYRYRVRAADAVANLSGYSSIQNATTQAGPDTQAPTVPTGLSATPVSASQINLAWSASTDNVGVTGYRVERCLGAACSNFVQVGTPTGASFDDTGLAAATTYRYRVRAADAAANLSGYSSIQNATTQPPPDTQAPSVPTGLSASAVSASQVNLAWTASTDNVGVTGYRVERCQGAGCSNFVQVATPAGASFNDTGLAAATSYSYRVRAADLAGNLSGYSSVQSATTQAGPDTQPPSVPAGLSATGFSLSQVNLAWTASTDNVGVTGYRVERCQGAGCSTFVQVGTPTGLSFNDTGLAAATSYSYRVRAADLAGNLSGYSSVQSATTFQESTVFTGLTNPSAIEFAADGRVFVAEKGGMIKVFDSLTDSSPDLFGDLSANVHNFWDRGMLGFALDPAFTTGRPYVYVLYTFDAPIGGSPPTWGDGCPTPPGATGDGCVVSARLSRLTASGNVMTGQEQVLINDWCQQYPSHSIGSLAFGADGALYVSGGDGASFNFADWGQDGSPLNPCGDPPGGVGATLTPPSAEGGALRSQDLRTTSDPTTLDGAILRVNPDTGEGMPNNPLASSSNANARRIIAHGVRNPFRLTIRPGTNEVWFGDVGWNTWEEINRVTDPLGFVENFGWPCYEGTGTQSGYDNANLTICENLYALPGGVVAPYYAYNHSATVVPGETCPTGSSSIAGVAFYPNGPFPDAYDGALFFADYSRDCIWVMFPGGNGLPDAANRATFRPAAANPVDLQVGPDGALYYADFDGGTIRRIASSANLPPIASATGSPTNGTAPLTVNFDGSGSSDPEGGPLSYSWDLNGDGTFGDSTVVAPTHTYTQAGTFNARLRVTDAQNLSTTSAPVAISVNNTPPTATIQTPATGTTWKVGDLISFSGSAADPQQGTLPASALSWELIMQHCPSNCHTHPLQTWPGVAGGSFSAPDHEYPSFLELRLTATDAGGLTDTKTLQLDPRTVVLSFQSAPAGLQLTVGSSTSTTPFTREVIEGSNNTVSAPTPQTVSGTSYGWVSWSDGGAQSHNVVANAAATYTATYQALPPGPTGLAAAYSFNEGVGSTVGDASGNGNVGATGSASWVTTGRFGSALSFNGAGARVTVPDSGSLDLTSAMTLEAWVFPTVGGGWRDVIYKGPDDIYFLESSADSGAPATGGTFASPIYGSSALPLNVWSHLAATYDGATLRLFVGGVQVASRAVLAPIATSTGALTIGGDALYGQHFAGRIDEVRIYGRALSASEIQTDMTTPVGSAGPPDTQAPSVPAGLSASAVSASQINLSWTASTDNVGVTGYRVERCQGAACSNFVQVATPPGASFSDTGLAAATTYRYRVRAADAATNLSGYSSIQNATTQAGPDTQPPTAPTGLSATAVSASQINLGWTASTDNVAVTEYRVERCQGAACSNFVQVATPPGTSFNDTGLAAATTYRYRVRAADAAANLSGYSSIQNATTQAGPDTQAPTVPAGLSATAVSASQINLAWSASTDNVGVTEYRVERCQGAACANFVQVATPPGTSFNDTGLAAATTYRYRVRAADAAGNLSGYSTVQNATTPLAQDIEPPSVPTGLSASAVSASQVNLAWTASTDNVAVTGYRVERCQGAGCSNFVQVGTPAGASLNDTGLAAATSYSYRVRAADAAGNLSGYSGVQSATTPLAQDIEPPSVPAGLSVSAVSPSQVNLVWTASTDNVGVTGYRVERCQGASCSNFVQVATPTGTIFNDTGLAASTSYSYRVRAADAATNLSGYSTVQSATTPAAGSGLAAAYSFSEGIGTSVADASGNGNVGAVGSASWVTTGRFGNALSFNGANARITVADSASLDLTTAMTLEAWVLPTVGGGWRDVIYKGPDDIYFLESSSNSGRPATGGIFANPIYGNSALPLNVWSHLAATYEGITLRLYVNGVQVSSRGVSRLITTSAGALTIGGDSLYGQHFAGRIDEVRVYGRALSASEIQADMTTPIGIGP